MCALLDQVRSYYNEAQDKTRAADVLFECVGTPAIPILIDHIDPLTVVSSGQKILSAQTLSRFGRSASAAQPRLATLLQDSDPTVRSAAQIALSRIGQ